MLLLLGYKHCRGRLHCFVFKRSFCWHLSSRTGRVQVLIIFWTPVMQNQVRSLHGSEILLKFNLHVHTTTHFGQRNLSCLLSMLQAIQVKKTEEMQALHQQRLRTHASSSCQHRRQSALMGCDRELCLSSPFFLFTLLKVCKADCSHGIGPNCSRSWNFYWRFCTQTAQKPLGTGEQKKRGIWSSLMPENFYLTLGKCHMKQVAPEVWVLLRTSGSITTLSEFWLWSWRRVTGKLPSGKWPGSVSQQLTEYEPAVCPGGQWHGDLYQKWCGEQD